MRRSFSVVMCRKSAASIDLPVCGGNRGPAGRAAGMMSTEKGARPRAVSPLAAIAIAVVTTLGALYIVSQFLRNSVAVIAPNLTAEVGLTPLELGLLSSIYFFVFAATQLPLGVALDRFRTQALHAGVGCIHRRRLCDVCAGGIGRRAGRLPSAARLRHGVVLDGAGRALCALVRPAAVFDAHRHSHGCRLARGAVRNRAAGLRHRRVRMARDLPRRRYPERRHRPADVADRDRRSARRRDQAAARDACARASPASGR